jgi:hypothetical protein
MIVYNVTYQVTHDLLDAWRSWLTESRIPAMKQTGLVGDHRIFQLLDQDETEGLTYVVQYHLSDLESFRSFEQCFPRLRNEPVPEAFFPRCMAFQTVMGEAK